MNWLKPASSFLFFLTVASVTTFTVLTASCAELLGSPTVQDGIIYVGSDRGKIRAFNMETGNLVWTFDTGILTLLRPVIHKNYLFVGGESGFLYSLDLKTGKENWKFGTGNVPHHIRDNFVNSIPTVANGIVYFTSEDFFVYALDVNTGKEIWKYNLGEETQQFETPLFDNKIFVGSWNGYVFAIDAKTGEEVWRSQTDNYHHGTIGFSDGGEFIPEGDVPKSERKSNQVPFVTVSPVFDENKLYFADWAGNLFGVDIKTGKQIIRFKPETVNKRHVGSRYYMNQTATKVVFATLEDKHVYSVEKNSGEMIEKLKFDGWIEGPIPAAGNLSFLFETLLSTKGAPQRVLVHGLDMSNMKILYSIENAAFIPVTQGEFFYLPTSEGKVEQRNLQTGELIKSFSVLGLQTK